jgi:hypothetical protein
MITHKITNLQYNIEIFIDTLYLFVILSLALYSAYLNIKTTQIFSRKQFKHTQMHKYYMLNAIIFALVMITLVLTVHSNCEHVCSWKKHKSLVIIDWILRTFVMDTLRLIGNLISITIAVHAYLSLKKFLYINANCTFYVLFVVYTIVSFILNMHVVWHQAGASNVTSKIGSSANETVVLLGSTFDFNVLSSKTTNMVFHLSSNLSILCIQVLLVAMLIYELKRIQKVKKSYNLIFVPRFNRSNEIILNKFSFLSFNENEKNKRAVELKIRQTILVCFNLFFSFFKSLNDDFYFDKKMHFSILKYQYTALGFFTILTLHNVISCYSTLANVSKLTFSNVS